MFVLSQINFPLKYRHLSWSQLSCTACTIKAHKINNILHCLFEVIQNTQLCWHGFNFMIRKNYRSMKQQTLSYWSINSIAYYDIYGRKKFSPITGWNAMGLFSCLPLLTPVERMWTWNFLWKQTDHHTLISSTGVQKNKARNGIPKT